MNPISFIFLNGRFQKKQSATAALPKEVECQFNHEGLSLRFPKTLSMTTPIHFVYLSTADYALNNTLILEENSQIQFIEEYVQHTDKKYHVNVKTKMILQKNAHFDFYKLQKENLLADHQADFSVIQHEASRLNMFVVDCGSQVASHHLNVQLSEKNASCALHGLYLLAHDQQCIQHKVHVDHTAPLCHSAMFYKGILDNDSEASFTGRVKVHPGAKKSQASQENHHLLLSKKAEAKSEPELEIYADDIQCTHGATVGQIDPAAIFYLCSRGMDRETAIDFLCHAFSTEVLNKIDQQVIRDYMHREVGLHAQS